MKKGGFWKNYGFLILMLTGIVAGCVVGLIWPAVKGADGEIIIKGATVLEPLGTVFLNLMFCIAVPTVFCSISSSIANMQSAKRAASCNFLSSYSLNRSRHGCKAVPGICISGFSRPARTGRQGVFRLCAVSASLRADISQKSLSLRHCGCPLSCI